MAKLKSLRLTWEDGKFERYISVEMSTEEIQFILKFFLSHIAFYPCKIGTTDNERKFIDELKEILEKNYG